MTQKGEHTWDLVLQYHRCSKCGRIIESREDYRYQMGKWIKEVNCDRCGHKERLEKKVKLTFGPLIGTPEPPEVIWR